MIDAIGREYAARRPFRSEPELEALVTSVKSSLEQKGIEFRVAGESYNPILMCEGCKKPTEHTLVGTSPSDEDPNFKYQHYRCSACCGVRVWGCEGGEE